jgi:uncharacterized protein YjiS (DUF1127 family)
MRTDHLAAFEAGLGLSSPPRSRWSGAPGRAVAWLASVWTSRRTRRSLHDLSDHLLADIGLRRDPRTPRGLRPPEPWFLARHLR